MHKIMEIPSIPLPTIACKATLAYSPQALVGKFTEIWPFATIYGWLDREDLEIKDERTCWIISL